MNPWPTKNIASFGEDLYADFNILRAELAQMDSDILQWASNVDEQWLDGMLTFESITYKKTLTIPIAVAVVQMFNHQTHHRGQITAILSQEGIDYGATDLPVMPKAATI